MLHALLLLHGLALLHLAAHLILLGGAIERRLAGLAQLNAQLGGFSQGILELLLLSFEFLLHRHLRVDAHLHLPIGAPVGVACGELGLGKPGASSCEQPLLALPLIVHLGPRLEAH